MYATILNRVHYTYHFVALRRYISSSLKTFLVHLRTMYNDMMPPCYIICHLLFQKVPNRDQKSDSNTVEPRFSVILGHLTLLH